MVSLEDMFLLKSTQAIHSLSGEEKRRKESLNKTKGTKSIEIYGKKALNLQCKSPKSKINTYHVAEMTYSHLVLLVM